MSELRRAGVELQQLRAWTSARIGLGHVGASMPTVATLDFAADHAAARDAVHTRIDASGLQQQLQDNGFTALCVHSRAGSRAEYLRRPDLGRRLNEISAAQLRCDFAEVSRRLTVVVADGLSAEAPMRYAVPLIMQLRSQLCDWTLDTVVVAEQARVALADEVGELRGAEAVLMLLGERPGLKAADSLGAYLTYAPRVGTLDAARNCVSNIREGGLSIHMAVAKLLYLLHGARALGGTGVVLKDNSELLPLTSAGATDDLLTWKGLLHDTANLLDR